MNDEEEDEFIKILISHCYKTEFYNLKKKLNYLLND